MIKLEFEIDESEYYEGTWAGRRRAGDWYGPVILAGTLQAAVGFALLIGADRSSWLAPVLLVVCGLFVTTYPWLRYQPAVKAGWKEYTRLGPVVWEFSPDCVRHQTSVSDARYSWYAFDRLAQTPRLFILYRRGNVPMLIPKRAFADAAQQQEFRQLADQMLHRLAPAFPVKPVG